MKSSLIFLLQLLRVIRKVSGSLYLSKTMAERTQNASLQHLCFSSHYGDAFKVWWKL